MKQGSYTVFDAFSMFTWKKIMLNRKWMDTGSAKLKHMAFKKAFSGLWGPGRELPEIAAGNFKQLWEERREGKIRK